MVFELGIGFGVWIVGGILTAIFFAIAGIPLHPLIWAIGGHARMTTVVGWHAAIGGIHFFFHSIHPWGYILSVPIALWIYYDERIFKLPVLKAAPILALCFVIAAGLSWLLDAATGFGLFKLAYAI